MFSRLDKPVDGELYKAVTIRDRRYALPLVPIVTSFPGSKEDDPLVVRGTFTGQTPDGLTRLFSLTNRWYAITAMQTIELWEAANEHGTVKLCTIQDVQGRIYKPESGFLLGLTGAAEATAIAYHLQHQYRERSLPDGTTEIAGRCEIVITGMALGLAYSRLSGFPAAYASIHGDIRQTKVDNPNILEIGPQIRARGTLHELEVTQRFTPAETAQRLVAAGQ